MRLVRWFIVIVGGVLVTLWLVVAVVSRSTVLQNALVQALNDHLDARVELADFHVSTFPSVRIHGDGLKVWVNGQTLPQPVVQIRHFEVRGGILGLLKHPRRFESVRLDGLQIAIPPRTTNDREAGSRAGETVSGPVIIDHVEANDATLTLVPRESWKEPKVFALHVLDLDSVGFNRSIPFHTTLTNPIPKGEIQAEGTFGPWRGVAPGLTPVSGRYTFAHADLHTIHGIGGTLSSSGDFAGQLSQIDVRGTTSTPDFYIEPAEHALPLETRFHVVVDGTDGNTYLKRVDATLGETAIVASGEVAATKGVKGRTVKIDAEVKNGRLQDVLHLAVAAPKPVMTGAIALATSLVIPPGEEPVPERIQMKGRFALEDARFTDRDVQSQVVRLSRHGQGKQNDEPMAHVLSDVRGVFTVRKSP